MRFTIAIAFVFTLTVRVVVFCGTYMKLWAETIKSVGEKACFLLVIHQFFKKTISAVGGITLCVQTRRNPRYVTASNLYLHENRRTERNHKQTGIRSVYVKHWGKEQL